MRNYRLMMHPPGSRDPVQTSDSGAGFVLVWKGSPQWLIGYPNDQEEFMQVISDVMLIAIPRYALYQDQQRDF
jgi:hypothetical protein